MVRAAGAGAPAGHGMRMTTRIDWRSCGVRLQCARVQVPLDWANPRASTISLAAVRFLVRRPAHRIGSLFVNFGGPGVPGVATLKAAPLSELDSLTEGRFDLVSWDPRGTGESAHVRCFADEGSQQRFWGSDAGLSADDGLCVAAACAKDPGVRKALRGSERGASGARLDR